MKTPQEILQAFIQHPENLANSFSNPLTFQEELLLNRLEEDLARKVDVLLELAFAGGTEIAMGQKQRDYIMDMMRFRKVIVNLISDRGRLSATPSALN